MNPAPGRVVLLLVERQRAALSLRFSASVCFLSVLGAWPLLAGTFTAFGPQTYQRGTGDPVTVTNTFTVRNPAT